MNIRRAFFISTLFLLLLACVVPGFSTNSTPAPVTPTADNRLPTMVAKMVAAALTQTAQAVPPTSTVTLPPTSTLEPSVTPTALPAGSTLTKQEDGSALFTDERAGYTVIIPEGWLAARVNEQDFFDALTFTELANTPAHEALTQIRDEDSRALRLFAVDIENEIAEGESASAIKFIWDEKQDISFKSDEDLQAIADELAKNESGLEVTSMDIVVTPAKMELGVIESETTDSDGVIHTQKRVFFKVKNGVMTILLTTGADLKETIIPAFDTIVDTVKLLE